MHFAGTADLEKMVGGICHHDGHANSSDFECTYHSDHDHGKLSITRPELP